MRKLLLLLPLLFAQPASAEVVNLECKLTRLSDNANLTWLITFDEGTQIVTRNYVEQGALSRYKNAIITADTITFTADVGPWSMDHVIDRNTGAITMTMDGNNPLAKKAMEDTGKTPGGVVSSGFCKKGAPPPKRAF